MADEKHDDDYTAIPPPGDGDRDTPKRAVSTKPSKQTKDPSQFYVAPPKTSDSAPIGAYRVSAAVKARVQQIVQSRRFPQFKTESDMSRAGIHFLLEHVFGPNMDREFRDEMQEEEFFLAAARSAARVQDSERFCRETRKALEGLMRSGETQQSKELFIRAWRLAQQRTDPFRTRVLTYLRDNLELARVRELIDFALVVDEAE